MTFGPVASDSAFLGSNTIITPTTASAATMSFMFLQVKSLPTIQNKSEMNERKWRERKKLLCTPWTALIGQCCNCGYDITEFCKQTLRLIFDLTMMLRPRREERVSLTEGLRITGSISALNEL